MSCPCTTSSRSSSSARSTPAARAKQLSSFSTLLYYPPFAFVYQISLMLLCPSCPPGFRFVLADEKNRVPASLRLRGLGTGLKTRAGEIQRVNAGYVPCLPAYALGPILQSGAGLTFPLDFGRPHQLPSQRSPFHFASNVYTWLRSKTCTQSRPRTATLLSSRTLHWIRPRSRRLVAQPKTAPSSRSCVTHPVWQGSRAHEGGTTC